MYTVKGNYIYIELGTLVLLIMRDAMIVLSFKSSGNNVGLTQLFSIQWEQGTATVRVAAPWWEFGTKAGTLPTFYIWMWK